MFNVARDMFHNIADYKRNIPRLQIFNRKMKQKQNGIFLIIDKQTTLKRCFKLSQRYTRKKQRVVPTRKSNTIYVQRNQNYEDVD